MKKTKIVIASVLKPVDDTRMFEKIGVSLGQTNKYDINIIGFSSKKNRKVKGIAFHPIFDFKRISWARATLGWKYLRLLNSISPKLIIVNTHELLLPTLLHKTLYDCSIVYDIRENYYYNIMHTTVFPRWLRWPLALWVRMKEWFISPWIDLFLLAEKKYEQEFSFSKGKSIVIENKYAGTVTKVSCAEGHQKTQGHTKLLFSGTIAKSTGVFEAVRLCELLHQKDPTITLMIIGYCAKADVLHELQLLIKDSPFIRLVGGSTLIPHEQIKAAIQEADFGIIYYPYNKSTIGSTPTKLYEYLANELPFLVQEHPEWLELGRKYAAGIPISMTSMDVDELLWKMQNSTFYPNGVGSEVYWESEGKLLIENIEIIISKCL